MEEECRVQSIQEWVESHKGRIYRYWVYKRTFTPYEQEQKFTDESLFEDEIASHGYIQEVIELPDNDLLIGFRSPSDECGDMEYVEYFKISEIRLAYCSSDDEFVNYYDE